MNRKDIIKCFDKSIWMQFANTGKGQASSKFDLLQDITFKKNNATIQAQYHHNAYVITIEEFSNEALAQAAFEKLQAVMLRYVRYRRFAKVIKNAIKWMVMPMTLFILALTINMAVTKEDRENLTTLSSREDKEDLTQLLSKLKNGEPLTIQEAVPLSVNSSELAKALADGVRAGKYSVKLSSGTKGVLYIFSDPTCKHCQELESELEKLAKNYTIHVFPVSVFGGEASLANNAQVLCQKTNMRKAGWKKIITGEDFTAKKFDGRSMEILPLICADGKEAVEANDKIFKAMNFPGTPMIINTSGEQFPDTLPNTETAIRQWMESAR